MIERNRSAVASAPFSRPRAAGSCARVSQLPHHSQCSRSEPRRDRPRVARRARRQVEHVIARPAGAGNTRSPRRAGSRVSATRHVRAHSACSTRTSWAAGEDAWTKSSSSVAPEAAQYRAASRSFESALALDPTRASMRDQLADLLFERLLRAKRDRAGDLADELAGRLAAYDDGRRQAELDAPAHITVHVRRRHRGLARGRRCARTRVADAFTAAPGPLVLASKRPGRAPARLPVLVSHGETVELTVTLPPAASGARRHDLRAAGPLPVRQRRQLGLAPRLSNSPPLHEVTTAGVFDRASRGHVRRVDRVPRRPAARGAPQRARSSQIAAVVAHAHRARRRSGGGSR